MKTPPFKKQHDHGASMVEYGFLVGVIVLGSIGAVATFGDNVKSYFLGTADILDHAKMIGGGVGGLTFVYGDPLADEIPNDPFEYLGGGGNFLMGTRYPDGLALDGTYDGVFALSGGDALEGSKYGEIFVGGPGDDVINGGKGGDTYSYSPGDGNDYIDESGGDSSTDTLNMPGISLAGLTVSRVGDSAVLSFAEGGSVSIIDYFGNFAYDTQFEKSVFADASLDSDQDFRDMIADKMKLTGNVYGTKLIENFTHTVSADGSYTIVNDHYLAPSDPGTLTFTDINPSDASFIVKSDQDLEIVTPDGDTVLIDDQVDSREDEGVSFIDFTGTEGSASLNRRAILDKAADDAKATGYVLATGHVETLFHDMLADGSYTLKNDQYQNPLENFEIRNATPDQVSFRFTGFGQAHTDFEMTFEDGDVVLVLDAYDRTKADYDEGIADILFVGDPSSPSDDILMDRAAIAAKAIADQIPSGQVRGADFGETLVYLPSYPNIDYYAGYGDSSFTDTLDLTAYELSSTTFVKEYYKDLVITLSTGQIVDVEDYFDNDNNIEEILIGDGAGGVVTLDRSAVEARAS